MKIRKKCSIIAIALLVMTVCGCKETDNKYNAKYETEEALSPDSKTLRTNGESNEDVKYSTEDELNLVNRNSIDISFNTDGNNIECNDKTYYDLNENIEYVGYSKDKNEIISYILSNYESYEKEIYCRCTVVDSSEYSNDNIPEEIADVIGEVNWVIEIYEYGYKNVMTVYGNLDTFIGSESK